MADGRTTIQLKKSTKNKLTEFGRKNDSYDEIINELIHERNFWEIHDFADESATDLYEEVKRVYIAR